MYRRILFLLLIFTLLFLPISSVHAAVETYTVNGQQFTVDLDDETISSPSDADDAIDGEVRHVSGDKINPEIPIGESTNPCQEGVDEETGEESIICEPTQKHIREKSDVVLEWADDDGNNAKKLLHDILENARLPLTPKALWDATVRNTNPQWTSWIARACDFRKQDDGPLLLIRNELSKEIMKLGPDPNIPPIVENLEAYNSFWGKMVAKNQYFQKASEIVKKATAYGCGTVQPAAIVEKSVKESQGHGIWDILTVIFHTVLFDPRAKNMTVKRLFETGKEPNSDEVSGWMRQADEKTFKYSRVDDKRKEKITKDGGAVNTFQACAVNYDPEEFDGEVTNAIKVNGSPYDQTYRIGQAKVIEVSTYFLQGSVLPAALQGPKHKVPLKYNACGGKEATASAGWNCNTSVPEQTVAGLNKDAAQALADSGIFGEGCAAQTENAWKLCNNDVIARAKKACIDPIFALAIWLHESGASNYQCSEQVTNGIKVQDFGVNIPSIAENFSAQIDKFLSLNYSCPHTIQDYISMYYIGNHCYNEEPDKTKIDGYVAELQSYYSMIGGGTLPSWPKLASCGGLPL